MLETVEVPELEIDAYQGLAPDAIMDRLRRCGVELRGLRLLHLNATSFGGGVSELLRSTVALLRDLGIRADWKVIAGDPTFFQVTKKIHNGLQGGPQPLTEVEKEVYRSTTERNAKLLPDDYDVVVVHDPQPAGVPAVRGKGRATWIWRCHIDTAQPNRQVWDFMRPYIAAFDAAIFTMPEFVPRPFPVKHVHVIAPAIDPLSPKNMPLDDQTARRLLNWLGISLEHPLISQVSRFDPWKDPLGVIAAYRLARDEVKDLQLALVGSMALDDPEGWEVLRQIQGEAAGDPHIRVFSNLTGVGNVEVNAFQRLSRVAVQKSIREGFGLVVSEALWKGTPVVAGRAGGIPLQMADGTGGLLVDAVEECARGIVELLSDPARATELGRSGRERVRQHFLLPRLLLEELELIAEITGVRSAETVPQTGG
jgi:trehalose synthase